MTRRHFYIANGIARRRVSPAAYWLHSWCPWLFADAAPLYALAFAAYIGLHLIGTPLLHWWGRLPSTTAWFARTSEQYVEYIKAGGADTAADPGGRNDG